MSTDVAVYTQPPENLIQLLTTNHLPHALPLLRRLRFTQFPGGISEHARIIFASATNTPDIDSVDTPFAAAYLDLSRGPETQIWLYSSLERRPDALASAASEGDKNENGRGVEEQKEEAAAECARRVLRQVKKERDAYFAKVGGERSSTILAGTLSEVLRLALLNRGVVFPYVSVYDKWLFRLDNLPDVQSPLTTDMRWDKFQREDIPLMLSRTNINRKERTIVLLPSMAVYRDDGTPIAWALLGPDSSLSSLHCEEEWRGKGFAKAVAVRILRERLIDFDGDQHCWADVAPDNPKSQRVCRSLGGKVAWSISWSTIDLDQSFPDQ
ncbi:uncharacterized protein F4822DRAFT_380958 [Hypoxylon trugodes]|uniref:uncharacterized protein n=1 Tax=Hypoxylon trugodes TaxID=326681 RepID=UPI00219DAFE7|nr:uncharacterized protein F4822DRAFT_380958 [Hypoxylon trugodes]KAI1385028.1 hypothetical protein F4822DRAFT_380958 [Hypoxylon trugodes]